MFLFGHSAFKDTFSEKKGFNVLNGSMEDVRRDQIPAKLKHSHQPQLLFVFRAN